MSNSPDLGDGDELPFSGVGSCSEDINGATNLYYLPLSRAINRDDDQLATNLHFLFLLPTFIMKLYTMNYLVDF